MTREQINKLNKEKKERFKELQPTLKDLKKMMADENISEEMKKDLKFAEQGLLTACAPIPYS